ncbi:MAG: LysM peptidoglycan-binding domain-containing protein [Phycisphaerae bacterium]
MRRDVKIGIAVGLGVVAVAVLYFVFTGNGDSGTDGGDSPGDRQAQDDDQRNIFHISDRQETETDGPDVSERTVTVESETPTGTDTSGVDTVETTTRPSGTDETVVDRESVQGYRLPRLTPLETETGDPLGDNTARATPDTGGNGISVDRPTTNRPRTYTVQEGDDGFWGISQKVYGHGKYWELIRDANPDVDSNALRAGQRLRIPALPEEDRVSVNEPESAPGSVRPLSGGRRIYTVQEGDLGFWGVSQTVYGTGRYAHLIARENPQADSSSLRPGQKLIIPPKPVEADTPEAARGGDTPVPAGGRTYTVQEGDKGFWGVAQKVYGDGTLWTLIQQANPGVDSSSLRAGQTLVIPPRSEAGSSRTSSRNDEDEPETVRRPVFD